MDLSKYYEEICRQPILTHVEEKRLVAAYKSKKKKEEVRMAARDKLLRANLRFVFKQAKRFSKNDPHMFKYLISAGNEGLIIGLEKFNPCRGTSLLSYAGWWVNQRILREMADMRIVSLPIWKQQLAAKIDKFKQTHEKAGLKELIQAFPDTPEKYLRELSNTKYLTYYIDDLKEDTFEIDPIGTEVDRNLDNKKIYDLVKALPSPHREVITMTFGMEDDTEIKLNQIAKKLMLTRDQVKEIKREALELIKTKLSTE